MGRRLTNPNEWRVPPRDPPDGTVTIRPMTPEERARYGPPTPKERPMPKTKTNPPPPTPPRALPPSPEARADHPLRDLIARLQAERVAWRTEGAALARLMQDHRAAEARWDARWRAVMQVCEEMQWDRRLGPDDDTTHVMLTLPPGYRLLDSPVAEGTIPPEREGES